MEKRSQIIRAAMCALCMGLALAACEETPNSPPPFRPVAFFIEQQLRTFNINVDASETRALVYLSTVQQHQAATLVNEYSIATAMFTDNTERTNPSQVLLNGIALGNDAPGQYSTTGVATPTTIDWYVAGYEGLTFGDTSAHLTAMNITNLSPGDTVSRSSGFTIQYEGGEGGNASVVIRRNQSMTSWLIDSTTASAQVGDYAGWESDDGSIPLTVTSLSSFSTPGYITAQVTKHAYRTSTLSNGWEVGVLTTRTVEIPLYLAP